MTVSTETGNTIPTSPLHSDQLSFFAFVFCSTFLQSHHGSACMLCTVIEFGQITI